MPHKLIGKRRDGSKVEMLHEDVGLLADGSAFRAIFVIDGERHVIDVARRIVDIHGARRRESEIRLCLNDLGIVAVEESHAA
jgi:hypothetical protein